MTDPTSPTPEDQHTGDGDDQAQARLRLAEQRREEIANDEELQDALADASTEAPPLPGAESPREEEHDDPDRTTASD